MPATVFDLEQAAAFLRKISFALAADDDYRAWVAFDHAVTLERIAGEKRAETITTPDCQRIDTHRCDIGDGHHVLADGTVA